MNTQPPNASAEQAEVTLDSIGDAVLSTDRAGNVAYLNAAAEGMTGWSRAEASGRPVGEVFRVVDGATREPPPRSPLELAIERNECAGLAPNSILIRRDGFESVIEDSVAPIRGRDGKIIGAVIVFRDVGAARALALQMSHRAQHDFLTGLPNPVLLDDRIGQAIALARRHDAQLALLFVDLDQFKRINDAFGHAAGDELLQAVALRLQSSVRTSDTVCRRGGDEFVVLLPEVLRVADVARTADKLLAAVAAPHLVAGQELRITASIGISVYPMDGADTGALLACADRAMYQAKKGAHNRYWFSKPQLNSRPGVLLEFPRPVSRR